MFKKIMHAVTILALLASPALANHCGHRGHRVVKAGRLVVKAGKLVLPPYRCNR